MAKFIRDAQQLSNRAGSLRVSFFLAAALIPLPISSATGQAGSKGTTVTQEEYEGWRQYSVHCARCHGQDVLGNPVAANLLTSTAEGGPTAEKAVFVKVVSEGRPSGGMPPLAGTMKPEQMNAVYAYVKGRADKRIPPGRPKEPN